MEISKSPIVTDRSVPSARAWWTCVAASVAGLLVSAYLTLAHLSHRAVACPASGVLDCELVTTGRWSRVLGVPVAVLGLVWFAAMLALTVPAAWRLGRWVARARFALACAGLGFVLYLVSVEALRIGAFCLWCTITHVLALVVACVVLWDAPRALAPAPAARASGSR